jgi:hypothetical protein
LRAKAAGTSLRAVLFREYGRHSVFSLDGRDAETSVMQYKNMPFEEKMKIDVIDGHYPVGLHAYAPKDCTYITLLRDPVQRVISHYYHVLRDPEHYVYKNGFTTNMSLFDYIHSGVARQETHNGQTWFLSGGLDTDKNPEGALEAAKQNIADLFSVVGLTKLFDKSIILMKRKLGWKKIPFYYRRHVATSHTAKHRFSDDVIERIKQVNELDINLYQYVTERLCNQIKQEGTGFIFQLVLYKLLNLQYRKYIGFRRFASEMENHRYGKRLVSQ